MLSAADLTVIPTFLHLAGEEIEVVKSGIERAGLVEQVSMGARHSKKKKRCARTCQSVFFLFGTRLQAGLVEQGSMVAMFYCCSSPLLYFNTCYFASDPDLIRI